MLNKLTWMLGVVSLVTVVFLTGCGSSTQIGLKFSPNDTAVYESSTDVIKDFRFEQPNLGKLKEEQTKTHTEMTYTQTIQDVDDNGNATAAITINDLKIEIVNKNEPVYTFDSEKNVDAPMSKLIGKSYTITITPAGTISDSDTKALTAAVTSSYERKIMTSIFDEKSIAARHEIAAIPEETGAEYAINDTWSKVVPSPPGLLAPKNFEKTYTLSAIKGTVADVNMTAQESGKPAEISSQSMAGGMGIFAKMFDNTDDYSGSMELDTVTGQVLGYNETLISTYIATETPQGGDPEKGPDKLLMRFTNRVELTKVQ